MDEEDDDDDDCRCYLLPGAYLIEHLALNLYDHAHPRGV